MQTYEEDFFTPFVIRILHRPYTNIKTDIDYDKMLQKICTVKNLKEYSHFIHYCPTKDLPPITDISIFKELSFPLWEHPSNKEGAQWSFRVKRELGDRIFIKLVCYILLKRFYSLDVNGIIMSIRKEICYISLWSSNYGDVAYSAVTSEIVKILKIPLKISLTVKKTGDSITDKSTFFRRRVEKRD